MAKIIALMNNKGGVLKTTLATNLAGVLSKGKKRVLLVDSDPQGNVATSFGMNAETLKHTLTEVILDGADVNSAIQQNIVPGLDLLPTNGGLNHFSALAYSGQLKYNDIQLVLQNVLQKVLPKYDYIIIDSAPYMDLTTINVVRASDFIVVPTQMELYATKGLIKMINDVKELGGTVNWIVPTLYDGRTTLHKQMLEQVQEIAKNEGIGLSKTKITKSIQATNAMAYERIPLVLTGSKSKQAMQYKSIVKELGL